MRILHVVPTYWPAFRYGGPIFSVHALCRALADSGHDVEVYTTNVDGEGELDVDTSCPQDVDGVRVSYFPAGFPRRLYRSPAMADALTANLGSFDVVHLHSTFLWPTLAAARVAEREGTAFVLSPRGMLTPELIEQRGKLRKRAWIGLFERRTVEAATFVHATTDLERDDIRRTGLRPRDVTVIPNGVELPEGSAADTMGVRENLRDALAGDDRTLLYLGRLSWKKALPGLIEALPAAPSTRLILAGPDDEELTPELQEQARRLGVAERVRFVGPVQGAEKRFLLENADLVVLPSRGENFGNVVLEALAHGTPALCTDRVGAAEVLRDARAGWICSSEPGGLANALSRFAATTPKRLRELGQRGREHVAEQYTWSAVAMRMLTAYERARSGPHLATHHDS